MSYESYATISAGDSNLYSKFTVKGVKWVNPSDHDEGTVPTIFNANSDVSLPKFWSEVKGLKLLYTIFDVGHATFSGSIGDGKIFIKTSKGTTITGPISGGPAEEQTFSGSGNWVLA